MPDEKRLHVNQLSAQAQEKGLDLGGPDSQLWSMFGDKRSTTSGLLLGAMGSLGPIQGTRAGRQVASCFEKVERRLAQKIQPHFMSVASSSTNRFFAQQRNLAYGTSSEWGRYLV